MSMVTLIAREERAFTPNRRLDGSSQSPVQIVVNRVAD